MDEQKKPTKHPEPVHQPGTGKGEEKVKKEGKEPGRHETGTQGAANRKAGKTTGRNSTSVNPKNPVDPNSPNLPTP
jgi:hypothetical protein